MRTEPIEHKFGKPKPYPVSFGMKFKTIPTSYGKRISGSARGYDYDVFVKEANGQIVHKLYYVKKAGQWIKSRLLYFVDNKQVKEVKCQNDMELVTTTNG